MRTALVRSYSAEEKFEFEEPLGAEALCGYLRANGQTCAVFDRQLDRRIGRDTLAAIRAYNPDVVGFSLMARHEVWDALRVLQLLHDGRRRFCAGGLYVTGHMEQARAQFPADTYLMRGMGEKQLLAFVTGEACEPITPDEWAMASRDNMGDYLAHGGTINIRSSIGCFGQCTFCLTPSLPNGESRWQGRSVEQVADEMATLAQTHPPIFNFVDDTFGTVERVLALGEALKRRKIRAGYSLEMRGVELLRADDETLRRMRDGGLCWLFVGLESLNTATLSAWRKPQDPDVLLAMIERCRKADIGMATGYILWHAAQTPQDAREEMKRLHEHGLFSVKTALSRMGVFPGTQLYAAYGGSLRQTAEPMSPEAEATYATLSEKLDPLYPLWFRAAVRITNAVCRDFVYGTNAAAPLWKLSQEMNELCYHIVFDGYVMTRDELATLEARLDASF